MAATRVVKMLRDAEGYPDGVRKQDFRAGGVYTVPLALCECFLDMGVAQVYAPPQAPADPPKVVGPVESKPAGPAQVRAADQSERLERYTPKPKAKKR